MAHLVHDANLATSVEEGAIHFAVGMPSSTLAFSLREEVLE